MTILIARETLEAAQTDDEILQAAAKYWDAIEEFEMNCDPDEMVDDDLTLGSYIENEGEVSCQIAARKLNISAEEASEKIWSIRQ